MGKKDYVTVDDSGDPGLKPGSSSYFTVAAVLFKDDLEAESATLEMKKFRRSLGWRDDHEFKFNKMRRDLVLRLLEIIVRFNFSVYALYIDKAHVDRLKVPNDWDSVYNQMILELLGRIPLHDAIVRIDGRYGKKYMRITEGYFRKELNKNAHKVDSVKFIDSKANTIIQLADIIVGSMGRSLQTEKSDSNDYIRLLRGKIRLFEEFRIQ